MKEDDIGAIDKGNILPEDERLRPKRQRPAYAKIDYEGDEDPEGEADPDYNPPEAEGE